MANLRNPLRIQLLRTLQPAIRESKNARVAIVIVRGKRQNIRLLHLHCFNAVSIGHTHLASRVIHLAQRPPGSSRVDPVIVSVIPHSNLTLADVSPPLSQTHQQGRVIRRAIAAMPQRYDALCIGHQLPQFPLLHGNIEGIQIEIAVVIVLLHQRHHILHPHSLQPIRHAHLRQIVHRFHRNQRFRIGHLPTGGIAHPVHKAGLAMVVRIGREADYAIGRIQHHLPMRRHAHLFNDQIGVGRRAGIVGQQLTDRYRQGLIFQPVGHFIGHPQSAIHRGIHVGDRLLQDGLPVRDGVVCVGNGGQSIQIIVIISQSLLGNSANIDLPLALSYDSRSLAGSNCKAQQLDSL